MKITLGASPWPWSKKTTHDFYNAVADLPIDTVVLGETVCPQRQNLSLTEWFKKGEQLAATGKTIRLATPSLVDSEEALTLTQAICTQSQFLIEISDITALGLLNQHSQHPLPVQSSRSFAASSAVALYNAHALRELVECGLTHWNAPLELTQNDLLALLASWNSSFPNDPPPELEITVYGHPLLSCSARCFAARAHHRSRAECNQVCRLHPTGQPVHSMEDERLFRLNGPQVLTGNVYNLLPHLAQLESLNISHLRIIPINDDIELLKDTISVIQQRPAHLPDKLTRGSAGYWFGQAGITSSDSL